MSRTKGARDKKPRRIAPASMANLGNTIPGNVSASVRIYAPPGDLRWFQALRSYERGWVITKARKQTDRGTQ